MKKLYSAPSLEILMYCSISPIGAGEWLEEEAVESSKTWNDNELGWT